MESHDWIHVRNNKHITILEWNSLNDDTSHYELKTSRSEIRRIHTSWDHHQSRLISSCLTCRNMHRQTKTVNTTGNVISNSPQTHTTAFLTETFQCRTLIKYADAKVVWLWFIGTFNTTTLYINNVYTSLCFCYRCLFSIWSILQLGTPT